MKQTKDLAYEEKLKIYNRRALVTTLVSSIVTCGLGFALGFGLKSKNEITISKEMGTFLSYYNAFKKNYYLDVDDRTLIDGLYYGLTSSVGDDFTFYVSSEKNQSQGLNTSKVGIGFERTSYYGNALLTYIMKNSPASRAKRLNANNEVIEENPGLLKGDIITKVREYGTLDDYYVLKDHPSSEWSNVIDGSLGGQVELVINRNNEEIRFVAERGRFDTDKIRLIEKNYSSSKKEAIVKVSTFLGNTSSGETTPAREMIDLFKEDLFKNNDSIDNLVLDLRGNGGGYVINFTELISLFTGKLDAFGYYYYPKTNTYSPIEAPNEKSLNSIYSYDGWKNYNQQIKNYTILIDDNTASAAESFALCMRDYKDTKDKVTIVGEISYGKGIAQSFYTPFSKDGDYTSSIRYTSGKVVSMEKNSINKRGIVPDVTLEGKYRSIQDDDEYDYYRKEVKDVSSPKDQAIVLTRIENLLSHSYNGNLNNAIKAFQGMNSLEITGVYNDETQVALNDAFFDFYHKYKPYNILSVSVSGSDDIDSFTSLQRKIVREQIELLTNKKYSSFYEACRDFQTIYESELGLQAYAYNLETSNFLQGKMYDLKMTLQDEVIEKVK